MIFACVVLFLCRKGKRDCEKHICVFVSVLSVAIAGFIAGMLVVLSVIFFDKLCIGDPVWDLSAYLVNGIFGPIAIFLAKKGIAVAETGDRLFFGGGMTLLFHQLVGVLIVGSFVFIVTIIVWAIFYKNLGIRVIHNEKLLGLD